MSFPCRAFASTPRVRSDGLPGIRGIRGGSPSHFTASVTGYYDAQRSMSDFVSECGTSVAFCAGVARVDGRSFGLEVLLRRSITQHLSGWLAYTLSRTERFLGRDTYLSLFDRTPSCRPCSSTNSGAAYALACERRTTRVVRSFVPPSASAPRMNLRMG